MSQIDCGLPENYVTPTAVNGAASFFCPLARFDYKNKKIDLALVTNLSASVPEGLVTVAHS